MQGEFFFRHVSKYIISRRTAYLYVYIYHILKYYMPKRYRERVSKTVCIDYLFIISIKCSGNRLNICMH